MVLPRRRGFLLDSQQGLAGVLAVFLDRGDGFAQPEMLSQNILEDSRRSGAIDLQFAPAFGREDGFLLPQRRMLDPAIIPDPQAQAQNLAFTNLGVEGPIVLSLHGAIRAGGQGEADLLRPGVVRPDNFEPHLGDAEIILDAEANGQDASRREAARRGHQAGDFQPPGWQVRLDFHHARPLAVPAPALPFHHRH